MFEFGILCAIVGGLLLWAEIRDRLHTAKAVLGDYKPGKGQ